MGDRIPYMTPEGIAEWFVERVAFDLKDGETFASAVEFERKDFQECVAEIVGQGDECSQEWIDVVKVMRQAAKEIADNARGWWEALDAEETRLFALTLPESTSSTDGAPTHEAHPTEGKL